MGDWLCRNMREASRTTLNVSGVIPYELRHEIEQDYEITPDVISKKIILSNKILS
jgi:hypothetical protein